MPRIEGVAAVHKALSNAVRRRIGLDKSQVSAITGYTAGYALHVHENLNAKHGAEYNAAYLVEEQKTTTRGKNKGQSKTVTKWSAEAMKRGYHLDEFGAKKKARARGVNQQAKYLEQPARAMKSELGALVVSAMQGGATLHQAIYMAALRLQREGQKIVPVDTGNLKASAFTRKE